MDVTDKSLDKTADQAEPTGEVEKAQQTETDDGQINIGATLVAAREKLNLTAQDIASEMNLTVSVIKQLENNQFDQNVPLAFVRGYMSSYAKKVDADVETLSVEFDRQTGNLVEPVQKVSVGGGYKLKRREINSSNRFFKLVTVLIIISILGVAAWEVYKRVSTRSVGSEQTTEIPLQVETADSATGQAAISTEAVEVTLPDVDESDIQPAEQTTQQITEPQPSSQPATEVSNSATDQAFQQAVEEKSEPVATEVIEASVEKITGPVAELDFIFSADCWVQVTDANGEVLAVGIKRLGKVMPISGVMPIEVILGEPSAVSLEVDGVEYDLSRYSSGRRAKFVVE